MKRPLAGKTPQDGEGTPSTNWEARVRYGIVGLLIVIAIVLVLAKVAIAGGILGAIALVLLILFLLGRL